MSDPTQRSAPRLSPGRGAAFSFSGVGYHTGKPNALRFSRADPGVARLRVGRTEIDVRRMRDLADGAGRCTRLGGVGPLEHFFAALCLLGVQGWILEAQHEDLPLFDGSALAWKEAILSTGERAKALEVAGPLEAVEWSDSRGRIRIEPASALDLEARWSQGPWGGEVWKGGMEDLEQLLMARTFVTAREYLHARESGLLAGAGPESGRLLRGRQIGEEETELARRLGADPQALVWTGAEPRLPGECAAHKALDLVGDWYLRLGGIPRGKILAEDAGHSLHLQIPQRLA